MNDKNEIKYSDVLSDLGKTQHVATVIVPVKNKDLWELRIEFRRGSFTDSHVDKIYQSINFSDLHDARLAELNFWDDPKVQSENNNDQAIGAVLPYDELFHPDQPE